MESHGLSKVERAGDVAEDSDISARYKPPKLPEAGFGSNTDDSDWLAARDVMRVMTSDFDSMVDLAGTTSFSPALVGRSLTRVFTSGLTSRRSQRGWALAVLPTGRGLFFGLVLTWLSFFR